MNQARIYHGSSSGTGGFSSGFNVGGSSNEYLLFKDDSNNVDYGFDWLHYEFSPINLTDWRAIVGTPEITTISYVQLLKFFPNDGIRLHFIIPWLDFTYIQYPLFTMAFAVTDTSVPDTKSFKIQAYGVRDSDNWRTVVPPVGQTINYSYSPSMSNAILHVAQTRLTMQLSAGTGPKFVQLDITRTDSTSGDPMVMGVSLDFPIKKIKDGAWFTSGTPMVPPP